MIIDKNYVDPLKNTKSATESAPLLYNIISYDNYLKIIRTNTYYIRSTCFY